MGFPPVLCFFWATAGALGDPAPLSGDLSDELDAVAEQLWKDELAKGIKPKASAVDDKRARWLSWFITPIKPMVYGRYNYSYWGL